MTTDRKSICCHHRRKGRGIVSAMAALSLTVAAFAAEAPSANESWFASPLSLPDAINLALRHNPGIQRAQKEIEAAEGLAIQTRAVAIPRVAVSGSYGAVQDSDIDSFRASPGVVFGNSQNWVTQVKVVQSLYEGGRILSSFRAARLARQQSMLNYQTAIADTVLAVQVAFYDILMASEQIVVEEASVELLTRELADTTRRFQAGTVPRFNVLRAEVELANARPRLITARHSLRIAKNNLANVLGVNLPREAFEDIPLKLAGKLDDEPFRIDLPEAISTAVSRRTELESLRKTQALRKEDIVNAKAGYLPSLQGYGGYDAHNSMISQDLSVVRYGWVAGAQLTWNIFDGLRTRGRVMETTANFERAGIDLDDAFRRVELEVRTAFSHFVEARELLESQKKVIEEALEAVRLAQARAEAGTGTQLDVLSAQTALTQSRTTQVQALHDYDVARARLQRAMGVTTGEPEPNAQPASK